MAGGWDHSETHLAFMSRIQKGLFAHWSSQVLCGENCSVWGSPVPACRYCKLNLECSGEKKTPHTQHRSSCAVLGLQCTVLECQVTSPEFLFYILSIWGFFPKLSLGWDKNQQENHLHHTIHLPVMETGFIFHLLHRSSPCFSAVPRPLPLAHSTFVLREELPLTWICIPHTRRVQSWWSQPLRCSLRRRALLHILPCILIVPRKSKSPFSDMERVKKGTKKKGSGNEVRIKLVWFFFFSFL